MLARTAFEEISARSQQPGAQSQDSSRHTCWRLQDGARQQTQRVRMRGGETHLQMRKLTLSESMNSLVTISSTRVAWSRPAEWRVQGRLEISRFGFEIQDSGRARRGAPGVVEGRKGNTSAVVDDNELMQFMIRRSRE